MLSGTLGSLVFSMNLKPLSTSLAAQFGPMPHKYDLALIMPPQLE